MANVISELPKIQRKGAGGRRGSKYPLDEWFDGQVRELVSGTPEQVEAGEADFSAKTSSIVNMLHTAASHRNLKLKSVKVGENNIAVVALAIEETNGKTEDSTVDDIPVDEAKLDKKASKKS